jgi:predicted  nucleic acid-binding Zn-ribbon protein
MSDTPRTEAEVNRQKCWSDDLVTIDANFACQLERELNAANVELEEKRKDIVWLATEKAKSENYVTELENRLRALWDKYDGERQHYMDRIKRLEEAGDVLAQRSAQLGLLPMAIEGWNKAKEVKP